MRNTFPLPHDGGRDGGPMVGIINGIIGSLAIWAVIAAVILTAS
ncbi:hypothetical protein [Sphingomonas sp. 2378]